MAQIIGESERHQQVGSVSHCRTWRCVQDIMAARPGFEPGLEVPKTSVLPLHHRAELCRSERERSGETTGRSRTEPSTDADELWQFSALVRLDQSHIAACLVEIDRPARAKHHGRDDSWVIRVPHPLAHTIYRRHPKIERDAVVAAMRPPFTVGVDCGGRERGGYCDL